MKLIILIYTVLLLSITVYVTGHLKNDRSNKKQFNVSNREIIVKADNKIVSKGRTDKKGNFKLNFNTGTMDTTTFNFYVIAGKDTIFLKGLSEFESDSPDLTFFIKTWD